MFREQIDPLLRDLDARRDGGRSGLIAWHPMTSLPDRLRDGRYLLLWEQAGPVVGRWREGQPAFWSTDFASEGRLIPIDEPLYWAEIPTPGVRPAAVSPGRSANAG